MDASDDTRQDADGTGDDTGQDARQDGGWLSGKHKWLALAMLLASGNAALGLIMSFSNIGQAAAAHNWHPWWTLAIMIDSGVPIYIMADHWLVAHGHHSFLARAGSWLCAGYTIILNGAVSKDADLLWKATHMIAPAQWVIGVEVTRYMWKALRRGDQPLADKAGAGRWLAAPAQTLWLWRRKHLLGVTWPAMFALEDARLFIKDLVAAAATEAVPSTLARAIGKCRFPAPLVTVITTCQPSEWEPVLVAWVAGLIKLDTRLRIAVSAMPAPPVQTPGLDSDPPRGLDPGLADSQTGGSGTTQTPGLDGGSGPGPDPVQTRSGGYRPRRQMEPAEIAELVRRELGVPPVPSIAQVMALTRRLGAGVGKPKARLVIEILEAESRIQAVR